MALAKILIIRPFSAGSGAAVLLEIARMLSIVYGDDSTRPKHSVMFALMPADGFNFISSKDYLEKIDTFHEENSEVNPSNQI